MTATIATTIPITIVLFEFETLIGFGVVMIEVVVLVDWFTEVIRLGVGNGVGDGVGICVGEGVSIFVGCGAVCVLTNLHIHFDLERINQW